MSSYETVLVETKGAVATVTINRPDAMNSFNSELRRELADALRLVGGDSALRAVVLTGSGRSFCAGADLKAGIKRTASYSVEEMLQFEYRQSFEAIMNSPKPYIAAVNGSAAGIGLSLALACDLVVMSDKSFLLSPFTTISLVGDGGSNWLLARQLGYKKAFELAIMSDRLPAADALAHGLINRVAPAESLVEEAEAWAQQIAKRAPLSVAATKKVMRYAMHASYRDTYDLEASLQRDLVGCDDNEEGVAAFFEKREPRFKG